MDPADYARILRARWRIVLLTFGLALAAAWFTTTTVVPVGRPGPQQYQASALLLSTYSGTGPTLNTMAALTTIQPVVEQVGEEINYEGDWYSLASRVSASADNDAGVLTISARALNPRQAERVANAFADGLLNYLRERRTLGSRGQIRALEDRLDGLSEEIATLDRRIARQPEGSTQAELLRAERNSKVLAYGSVSDQYQHLLSQAREPDPLEFIQDASARPIRTGTGFEPPQSRTARLLLGGIVGLLAGAALALVLERMNSAIRTKEGAEQHFGLPVLAEVPEVPRRYRRSVAIVDHPTSPIAEAARLLAAGVELGARTGWSPDGDGQTRERSPQVILVTSPAPGDGKTSVVANLAGAYAEMGKRTLVLSCDFRHPEIQDYFNVSASNGSGLADALRSEEEEEESVLNGHVVATGHHGIEVVPSGFIPERPGELLSSDRMRRALQEARGHADVVLIDTPPVLAAGDAAHLLPQVDAVLLVARAGKTTTRLAERTSELLRRMDAPVVGVALNAVKDAAIPRGYYRGSGYGPADVSGPSPSHEPWT